MQINSINNISFAKKIQHKKNGNNPNPTTPPPLPPGSGKLNTTYIYIPQETNNDELAINENPRPKTQPPMPPGYGL